MKKETFIAIIKIFDYINKYNLYETAENITVSQLAEALFNADSVSIGNIKQAIKDMEFNNIAINNAKQILKNSIDIIL